MSTYTVKVRRTEEIEFEVEADNKEEAENRYLSDGEETWSRTRETTVVDVFKTEQP